jgi:hypothetical protein
VGEAALDEDEDEDEDAREGESPSNWLPKAAAIAPRTTSRTATRILRIRIRRGAVRARSLQLTPPVKAAWCCQHVCDFRYADDMRRL